MPVHVHQVQALSNTSPIPPRSSSLSSTVKIIFSDIDGSLVHYPTKQASSSADAYNPDILSLPPSATGLQGIISSKTLATCRDLRVKKGIKLVLVTGARTSTLLNRLPYLPKADAYCTEAGGRIFYPISMHATDDENNDNDNETNQFTYAPVEYNGAHTPEDLAPFGLREDMEWRQRMEVSGAGTESFSGNEITSNRCHEGDDELLDECLIDYETRTGFPLLEEDIPVCHRKGSLWDYANYLVEEEGFVLDTKSYSTCFRVNKKHQTNHKYKFEALLTEDIVSPYVTMLGKSTNLGCIDFYPMASGKGNCCHYLANTLMSGDVVGGSNSPSSIDLSTESVCICDDDNDIEMALACSHSYIPSLSSTTMIETLEQNKSKFTKTFGPDIVSTDATDVALDLIYNLP